MEGIQQTDPFLWDEDVVISELCALTRPCSRNLEDLAARIRENEIDGHSLLTYDLVGEANGHDLRNELYQTLNVKLIKHKNALGEAIMMLRRRSQLFQQWKLDHLDGGGDKEHESHDHGRRRTMSAQLTPQPDIIHPVRSSTAIDEPKIITPPPASTMQGGNLLTSNSHSEDPCDNQSEDRHDGKPSTTNISAEISKPQGVARHKTQTKELKRKRVAPQLLQDKPLNLIPIPLATEADALRHNSTEATIGDQDFAHLDESEDELAYLGAGVIDVRDVKSPLIALTRQLHGDGDVMSTPVPTKFPPGKRLVINRIMRRLLIKNNRTSNVLDSSVGFAEDVHSFGESDKILNLDDLPDELDEETRKEMETERAEASRRLEAGSRLINTERIRRILDEEISDMKEAWTERKLPKYFRKKHAIWSNASKLGTKSKLFERAVREARRCDDRIKRLEAEIMNQAWEKERDIRLQAKCLEQSVEDRLYHSWLADILSSRFEPPKPLTQSKKRVPSKTVPRHVSSDEEILTSSDDESFIVDDDKVVEPPPYIDLAQTPPAPRIKKSQSPVLAVESPIYIDLTQIDSSAPSTPTGKPAFNPPTNLPVTPVGTPSEVKALKKKHPDPPPIEQVQSLSWPTKYNDVKRIASQPPNYWSKQKERYALVITLLWRLGHSRRSAVLEHVQQNPVDESFRLTIGRHIANPVRDITRLAEPGPDTLAFDVSRLFLCFLKVKNLKETRLADLRTTSIERLRAQQGGNSWAVWHDFLTQMAPLFPQENQIWREDVSDSELIGDNEEEEGVASSVNNKLLRRAAPKEVVQNKDAVDLRERERRRADEQEARRRRLRANLGSTVTMPSDKSRLIINESKQDDQSFIYINQDIGNRIKDHQIDGVRFMWNQILQDPDLRQGCLLSHSMGLGKTMQVITLLVAIQESSKSSDPSVVSQIPEDLRPSKTLVLCPAGLVNNWIDELLTWDVDKILGGPFSIDSTLSEEERTTTSAKWSQNGGVLVIGYNMLKQVYGAKSDDAFFSEPNLVVADEAHTFKNPASQNHMTCSRFRTKSRIAMTGSPLANNIEEYYFMIDWVAPNFLGPLPEFREIYANPIQQGVSIDSDGSQKRRALKMLQALKKTVAPKVHRATVKSCMAKDLPPKREFVLCLKPKPLQVKLYNLYLAVDRGALPQVEAAGPNDMLSVMSSLGLICNHPSEFFKNGQQSKNSKGDSKQPRLPRSVAAGFLDSFGSELGQPSASTKVEMLIQILDYARAKGDKVLVFSQSIPTLNYLSTLFAKQNRRFNRLDGGTAMSKRQEQIKRFNINQAEFYLISTRAGGIGLNIQGANRVVIFDFQWNPVHEQQAVGRAYRIGQTKPVTVYYFVTAGTFEQDLHGRTVFKSQLASRVVDETNPISWGKRNKDLRHDIIETKQKELTGHIGKDSLLDILINQSNQSGAIQEIIPTDTFEEEDERAPLSLEEQKEADDMVRLHLLRHSNLEEFRRLKEVRELKDKQSCQPVSRPNNAAPSMSRDEELPASVLTRTTVDIGDTPSLPTSGVQLSAQLPSTTGTIDIASDAAPSAQASRASTQHHASLMPIPGAQTFFGNDTRDSPKAQGASEASIPASTTPTTGMQDEVNPFMQYKENPFNSVIKNPRKTEFRERMSGKLNRVLGGHPAYPGAAPAEVLDKIIDSIHTIRQGLKHGFLPDSHHWGTLVNFVEYDRFIVALMSGVLKADYLANADIGELERNMNALNKLPQSEFDARLGTTTPASTTIGGKQ
ncbi:hypothetical protein EsDP_00001633 [Epichloe bromicola]|uniref:Uncharacterized protein n=1 Tax=Epichloe bromicola TaxID=79588 RepID=A0ABQ0CIF3_9HYPO